MHMCYGAHTDYAWRLIHRAWDLNDDYCTWLVSFTKDSDMEKRVEYAPITQDDSIKHNDQVDNEYIRTKDPLSMRCIYPNPSIPYTRTIFIYIYIAMGIRLY